MASYLAEKYAYLLTKEDAKQLFDSLVNLSGSVSEAARKCNIQSRKTIYDWKETSDIKLSTKTKILNASLGNIPDKTLSFLLKRSEESTSDILHVILSRTFEIAMKQNVSKESFIQLTNEFTIITKEHAGIVLERLEEEVGEMTQAIRGKAFDLKVDLPPVPIETMKPAQLLELLPIIMKAIPEKVTQSEKLDLAQKLNIPIELVDASSALASTVRAHYEVKFQSAAPQTPYPVPKQPSEFKYGPNIFGQELIYPLGQNGKWGEAA
jgi:hypothetical protein